LFSASKSTSKIRKKSKEPGQRKYNSGKERPSQLRPSRAEGEKKEKIAAEDSSRGRPATGYRQSSCVHRSPLAGRPPRGRAICWKRAPSVKMNNRATVLRGVFQNGPRELVGSKGAEDMILPRLTRVGNWRKNTFGGYDLRLGTARSCVKSGKVVGRPHDGLRVRTKKRWRKSLWQRRLGLRPAPPTWPPGREVAGDRKKSGRFQKEGIRD
jgi:hypothetical protein